MISFFGFLSLLATFHGLEPILGEPYRDQERVEVLSLNKTWLLLVDIPSYKTIKYIIYRP